MVDRTERPPRSNRFKGEFGKRLSQGELRQIFEDVPRASIAGANGEDDLHLLSGSVLAQKLLFANTEAGDLTPFIDGYYDTNFGKKGPDSYAASLLM
jgi:methionine salvage enolase-phosphatase E1